MIRVERKTSTNSDDTTIIINEGDKNVVLTYDSRIIPDDDNEDGYTLYTLKSIHGENGMEAGSEEQMKWMSERANDMKILNHMATDLPNRKDSYEQSVKIFKVFYPEAKVEEKIETRDTVSPWVSQSEGLTEILENPTEELPGYFYDE